MGFDTFNVGPELEYFLFRDTKGTEVLDNGGYFDLTTLDAGSDVRRETVLALEQLGIHVEYTHHEVGPSQHEIDMRYADALKMADDCMTYRITVKEYAMKYGWHATFMPKPLFGENGSGMHTHMSLFQDGKNAFFDADDPYFLSDIGKAFIAGQLKHAREISSIFAQWVNSYKRLVPGFEAPVYVAWSRRNRSALVRVPLYHPGKEKATRMELRCPDPACNPYLTFAALLHAGLEGIEKGYELPEPMEKNLYHLSPDDRRRLGIEQLPETLGEAIELTAGVRARPARARRAHVQPLRGDQASRVGGLPRAGQPVGARPLPAGAVTLSRVAASGTLTIGGDLEVHRLGFGAMRIVGPGILGPPTDRDGVLDVLRRVVALDVNLIDTADSYGPHVSEELIAEALHPYPEGLVIAHEGRSRAHRLRRVAAQRAPGAPARRMRALAARLQVERIDLYQLHAPRSRRPLRGVGRRARGAAGRGQDPPHRTLERDASSSSRRRARSSTIVTVQNRFNLTDRTSKDVLDVCERDGLAFFPWVSARRRDSSPRPGGSWPRSPRSHDATPARSPSRGCSPARR